MKAKFLIVLLMFLAVTTYSQTLDLRELNKEIAPMGLQFAMPTGYQSIQTLHNRDLHYSFALLNADSTMEVRYSFFSIKPLLKRYKKELKAKRIMLNPDSLHVGLMLSNGKSMTNGIIPVIEKLSADSVKRFNADYAGTSSFEYLCEFGKGYRYGQFVCIHKDKKADVIISFLSNDKKRYADLMAIPYYALTFK